MNHLQQSQDKDDRDDVKSTLEIVKRLCKDFPDFYLGSEQERTMLLHDDFS